MLFSNRKKEADRLLRENAGESFWLPRFTSETRSKIVFALYDSTTSERYQRFTLETAHAILCREHGQVTFCGRNDQTKDLLEYFGNCADEDVPDVIEAMLIAIKRAETSNDYGHVFVKPQKFHDAVNEIMQFERVSFEIVAGKMIDFESKEMHEAVVVPTLNLLSGRAGWEAVETSYQSALDEIGRNPGDSITDATTALQQALVLLHCAGNSLGDLAKSGVARGILTPYDAKLIDWASADRGKKGDAHNDPDSKAPDSWLTVHVVGALILRLASDNPR